MDDKRDTAIVRVAETAVIELTPATVKRYVNQFANEQEIALFLNQCGMFGLNPFKREIHLVKYSSTDPATFVVGYDAYLKRAERTGKWDGMETGWTDGPDGKPLSAWVKVHRKDWSRPLHHTVLFSEYCQYRDETVWENGQKKKTGRKVPTSFWASKPHTMLLKVAIAQAFRMAFPDELGGMPYMAEEIINEPERLATAEIIADDKGRNPYESAKAKPLPRVKDEFDPGDETPKSVGNGPVRPEPAAPAPTHGPDPEKPVAAQSGPNPANPPAAPKRGPGRPPKAAKTATATDDPNDPNWKAPFDDDTPPADNAELYQAPPEKIQAIKDAIVNLKTMGVSEEKIYIGINRNLVANKQMVIAELGDLSSDGAGVALAYINAWRHKLADDRAKAEAGK